MRPKARRRSDRPEIPERLLDDEGRIPSGPDRLWPLLDYLAEVDAACRWHDPLTLLAASGARLDDVLAPAPDRLPDFLTPTEGDPT